MSTPDRSLLAGRRALFFVPVAAEAGFLYMETVMDGNSNRVCVIVAAGFLLLVVGGLWLLLSDENEEKSPLAGRDEGRQSSASDTADAGTPPAVDDAGSVDRDDALAAEKEPVEPEPPVKEAATGTGETSFSGKAVDTSTGQSVNSYDLSLRRLKTSDGIDLQPYAPWREESIDSPDGSFSIPIEEGGHFIIKYEAAGYQRPDFMEIDIAEGRDNSGFVLELTPGLTMTGCVVADATGTPLAGAEVVPFIIRGFSKRGESSYANTRTDGEPTVAGPDGRFIVTGLKPGAHRLWARHPDFAESYADGEPGGEEVVIRLKSGYRFFGLVRDTDSQPVPGIDVIYYSMNISTVRHVPTGADGRYTTPPLPPGRYNLSIAPDGKVTREMLSVDLEDRDVEVNFGPRPGQVIWRGRLFDGKGIPVPKAVLKLYRQVSRRSAPERIQPKTALCQTKTDDLGNFEIGPFEPGIYDVCVQFDENDLLSTRNILDRIEFDQEGLVVRDLYLRSSELSGLVVDGKNNEPVRNSRGWVMACTSMGKIFTTSVDNDGRFRFIGLPPETYNLYANGPQIAQGSLLNVVLGETSIINDLKIVIPIVGTLELKVTGLEEIANQGLEFTIDSLEDDRGWTLGNSSNGLAVDHTGVCEFTTSFEAGSWKIVLQHESIGQVERTVVIRAGETTKIEIDRNTFVPR